MILPTMADEQAPKKHIKKPCVKSKTLQQRKKVRSNLDGLQKWSKIQ